MTGDVTQADNTGSPPRRIRSGRGEQPRNTSIQHNSHGEVNAVSLTQDLLRSRERLVAATEEERRRLRRDLHDGLGPGLAGVVLGLQRARRHVDVDPANARK